MLRMSMKSFECNQFWVRAEYLAKKSYNGMESDIKKQELYKWYVNVRDIEKLYYDLVIDVIKDNNVDKIKAVDKNGEFAMLLVVFIQDKFVNMLLRIKVKLSKYRQVSRIMMRTASYFEAVEPQKPPFWQGIKMM